MPVNWIPAVAAAALIALTALPGARAQTSPSTATQTVDTMNAIWGRHPGLRANHTKGIVVEGSFTPSAGAAQLSKASIFAGPTVPMIVRFSNSTGIPALADGADDANPHGMAMRFRPPGGGEVDVVANSLPFFPVATGEEFLELLQALSVSGPDAPKPTKADQFIAAHASVVRAVGALKTPTSYAQETYNGVNAFIFVNAEGARQPFRFQFVPVAGAEYLSAADAKARPADFLLDELRARLAKAPVAFRLTAQLANPGDQTKDGSQPWPADRRVVELGTITLTKAADDNAAAERGLRLLPNHLAPGIEVSDDPLIDARVRSYLISFGRRS